MTEPPYFEGVYYSNFWYSRHYQVGQIDYGGNVVENDIERHKRELRLFAIFFDRLYIPRGHFLSYSFAGQQAIVDAILSSTEFNFLRERGVLRISTLPGLDGYEDNERITSRRAETDAVLYPTKADFLRRIPADGQLQVNSINESARNKVSFPEFGTYIRTRSPALADLYLETIKEAQLKDIPFFHESFVRLLRSRLPDNQFDPIWRATNSIYLTSGVPEYDNIIASFNDDIESLDYRFARFGVDRYLYSFSSLYSFACTFLGEERVSKLLFMPIEVTHQKLYELGFAPLVRRFRAEYQNLVAGLSSYTRQPALAGELDQRVIRALLERYLDAGFRKRSAVALDVLGDVATVSKGVDANAGVIAETLRAATKYGSGALRTYLRRRRFPNISEMMSLLGEVR